MTGTANSCSLSPERQPDLVTGVTGQLFLAQSPEVPAYDADGNLTTNGQWIITWDAENRPLTLTARPELPAALRLRLELAYDWQGRRVSKRVSLWNGSGYTAQSTNRFVHDGWNLLVILNSDFSLLTSFTWGSDLSGTAQGAGGVGGLLWLTRFTNGPAGGAHFAAYDGNGNVSALFAATDGTESARYEYGPFGEPLRVDGVAAASNPFRFSTKFLDPETGWLHYGYRSYDPATGRWLNRDPINELGFNLLIRKQGLFNGEEEKSLYGFVRNNPITNIDPDGREVITIAITVWSVGKGISHVIVGCYNCARAIKCRNQAQATLDQAVAGFSDALELQEWLKAAKPGIECAPLWADCGREAVLSAQWFVGGYIVKYGIRYARGYGKPQ